MRVSPAGSLLRIDLLERLAGSRRWSHCVAPTLYGEGADLAAWALPALDAAGGGPVVVVGNSIGGSCAVEVGMLAPTKVKGLVLCGAKAGHRPEPDLGDEALDVLEYQGIDIAWGRYWRPLFGPDASAAVVEQGWRTAQKIGASVIAAACAHSMAELTARTSF